jgi:hypothetical protein
VRTLTTAIDEGEHKVPEGHKVTRYALAPGEAMVIEGGTERYVMKISPDVAKIAKYRYLMSWLEGRTVAEFDLYDTVVAQPVRDDPKPKRSKRADEESDRETVEEGRAGVAMAEPGGSRVSVPPVREAARARGGVPMQEGEEAPPRKPRKEKPPLEWL